MNGNTVALKIEDLSYEYSATTPLINNVSLELNEGDILTILGRNGCGKTTLINCILGFNGNFRGKISIFGKLQSEYTRKEMAMLIGYVPQLGQVSFDYTVEEFILMGCSPNMSFFEMPNSEKCLYVDDIMLKLEIKNLKDRYVTSLSGGERQLVYIARALAQNAKIIVLDEPTSALDIGNSYKIIDMICSLRNQGYTIILSCHNPDYSFMLKGMTIAMLEGCKYLYGRSDEIITDKLLTELYGIKMKKLYLSGIKQCVCVKA